MQHTMEDQRTKIRSIITTTLAVMAGFIATAQQKQDIANIKQLCGCFGVTFNYAETFTNDTAKKRYAHPMDNFAVTELAYPIEESNKRFVIQHLLVIPDGKGTVIKHWREDWQYEQTETWQYTNNKEWSKTKVPLSAVKGQWTQSVWEVSDAPRYTGSSNWVYANNQHFWLNTTDAPLPRREYTTRKDYNILNRTNRITVDAKGYMHEQDNKKIIRMEKKADSLLAEEKGYNKYVRLPDAACEQAKKFWSGQRAAYWADVRVAWEAIMRSNDKVVLQSSLNGKVLHTELDELEASTISPEEKKKQMEQLIKKYMIVGDNF